MAVFALAIALALVVSSGSQASASTTARDHVSFAGPGGEVKVNRGFAIAYKRSWTFKSRPLHRCVVYTVSGDFKYHLKETVFRSKNYFYSNQRISDPKMTATVLAYGGHRCGSRARVSKITLAQYWTGYSCSYNPSLGFSLPWGISFGFWPNCGNRDQVGYQTDYGRGSYYVQHNTGSKANFGNYTSHVDLGSPPIPPCYGVYPASTVYEGNTSDSYGAGNLHKSAKVCLYKV